MATPLERIATAAAEAIPSVLPGVEPGTPTILPRGADPFAGAERPLLIAATRWTAVSPGGVIFGGAADALGSVLGFEVPARPTLSAEDAEQHRRATDDADDADAAADDNTDGEPEAQAEPEAESAEGDGAPDGDAEAAGAPVDTAAEADADADRPAPARRWSDHVAEASRDTAAAAGDGIIRALATLVGLPPGAAATQAVLAESDAMVAAAVGPLPDAIVIPLRRDGAEIRLVVVVAGIVAARVSAAAVQVGSASGPGAAPVEEAEVDPAAIAEVPAGPPVAVGAVPLDLCAEIGTTRMPLSAVLSLREGAVVELAEAVDAPIQLVAGATPVAAGELELDDAGGLVLHVTAIPGRPDLTPGPMLVDDPAPVAAAAVAEPAVAEPATDEPAAEPASDESADGPADGARA